MMPTSVGITARVLQGAGALATPAALVILAAAVLDDIVGMIVLAIVRPCCACCCHTRRKRSHQMKLSMVGKTRGQAKPDR